MLGLVRVALIRLLLSVVLLAIYRAIETRAAADTKYAALIDVQRVVSVERVRQPLQPFLVKNSGPRHFVPQLSDAADNEQQRVGKTAQAQNGVQLRIALVHGQSNARRSACRDRLHGPFTLLMLRAHHHTHLLTKQVKTFVTSLQSLQAGATPVNRVAALQNGLDGCTMV